MNLFPNYQPTLPDLGTLRRLLTLFGGSWRRLLRKQLWTWISSITQRTRWKVSTSGWPHIHPRKDCSPIAVIYRMLLQACPRSWGPPVQQWPFLSPPPGRHSPHPTPPSPSSLNFATKRINPNLAAISMSYPPPPPSAGSHNPLPGNPSSKVQGSPLAPLTSAPPSGCYTNIPPLLNAFPSSSHHIPEIPHTNPSPCGGRQESSEAEPRLSKKYKCFKSRVENVIIWLGEDIQWGDSMDTVDQVLVGRIRGRSYTTTRLKLWTLEVWGHHLADFPFIQTFVRGWFALHFSRAEHTNWVLSSFWHFQQAPILLCRRNLLFDPERE